MRRTLLVFSLLASIATSYEEQPLPEPAPELVTRAVLENRGEIQIALGVAVADGLDCELLATHPWLAAGLVFDDEVVLLVEPDGEVPLLDVLGVDEAPACYAARVRLDDHDAIAFVQRDRSIYGPSAETEADPERLDIAVFPEAASVFVDGGVGLLQQPDLPTCADVVLPSWTPVRVEGFIEEVREEADCIELKVQDQDFELCGAGPLAIEVGAAVRIEADETVVELDVIGGPWVVAGRGLAVLGLEPTVQMGQGTCAAQLACGAVAEGVVDVDDSPLRAGDVVERQGGELTVFSVDRPLQEGCDAGAEILYVQP